MPRKLFLFPFGGNAREALGIIHDLNRLRKTWDVAGFLDDDQSTWGQEYLGVKVLGGKAVIKDNPRVHILAVPGNPQNYLKRKEVIVSFGRSSSCFVNIIHPSAVMAPDAQIGYNTLIMPNVVLTSHVVIGNHCVILPNSTISHDAVIGDYCCIGSNVSIAGGVVLGESCYLGSGSRVRECVKIGRGSMVGLGSNVLKDVADGVTVVGNPAKPLQKG